MTRSATLTSLFLLTFVPATALADCMNGYWICNGDVTTYVATPDPVRVFDCSRFHVESTGSFDHIQGLANAQSMSVPGNTAGAQIYDEFVLTGPPAGTVVPIVVVGDFELQNIRQVNAVTHSDGSLFTPPITGGPSPNAVDVFFTASAPGTETATRQALLPMNVKAGVKFEISMTAGVFSSGNAGGYSHGRLSFSGLPPGSSITSCKGFRQDAPVPALPSSWGRMKALYR